MPTIAHVVFFTSHDLEGMLCEAFPNRSALSLYSSKICDLSHFESMLGKENF